MKVKNFIIKIFTTSAMGIFDLDHNYALVRIFIHVSIADK